MKLCKIYGPPGTGKTYRLISRARAYARIGSPLDKIGYFAFTKKAAKEAKERMPFPPKRLRHFQTLHSLAFNTLSLSEDRVMQPYHYEDLGKLLNIRVRYQDKFNKEETHFLTCDNPYYQLIGRAMNKDISIEEEFNLNEHNRNDVSWNTLKHISTNLVEYKKNNNLIDFNDMIHQFINKAEKCPEFDTVFIDEAQDLSKLQWKMFEVLKQKSKHIYLAGDDDQAIFSWAGADVDSFIDVKADKEIILNKSRRIPKNVQTYALQIIDRIQGKKVAKNYKAREVDGKVEKISDLSQINIKQGKWLILARTGSRLRNIMDELKRRGIYCATKKEKSFSEKLYRTILLYQRWCKGEPLEEHQMKEIKEYTGEEQLDKDIPWFDSFVAAKYEDKLNIRNLLSNGEKLSDKPRVFLSTIHSIKGGEEENVIVALDLAHKIRKALQRSQAKRDEEHRVFYVAYTRAAQNLYLLKSKIERKGYQI